MSQLFKRQTLMLKRFRGVNTWSPLATTFNSITKEKLRNFTRQKESGLFGIPELKHADGFSILRDQALHRTDELIAEATEGKRKRKMVEIFDELSDTLCKVADLAEFIRLAHTDERFLKAAEECCISISRMVEKLNTHRELYNALHNVEATGDIVEITPMDAHVAKLFLFDFEQCGIHLPEVLRKQVVHLNDNILQVGQKFMAGAISSRIIDASVLPSQLHQHFEMKNGQILVHGLYTDSPNTVVREAAYKLFLYPDQQQESLLAELLNSRHDLAQICGFPTYVHRALRGSTAESPTVVKDFLNILSDNIVIQADRDFKEMQNMKDKESSVKENLMPWDTAYFSGKAKRTWLDVPLNQITPYFSLGSCMDGLNILTQSLYGIRLETAPILAGEVWAQNIHKLAVIDENEYLLGHIYCDFFEREGKPNQDCHFTIRGGKELPDGSYQNPVVVLMLSLPLPRWSNPCLLTPSSVENLFHEMGHALHSMLGRTKYQHVTGTRCSTDFAEVPSILMEYFACDSRVVSTFARHFQTREQISEDLVRKLCTSKNIFCASELQNQVFYSMLDYVYHSDKITKSTTEILKEVQNKYYGLPYVENTAWQLRFSHLVGYGAKYYSYLMSRAIASWIWQTYFQKDPLSRTAGERYRRECLAYGGAKPAAQLIADFLNKKVTPSKLAKSLLSEIDMKTEVVSAIKH